MKFFNKIREMMGYRYMVNLRSKEIHDLKNTHANCNLELIVHKKFITQKMLHQYLHNGYNGCRWCMPEYNKE